MDRRRAIVTVGCLGVIGILPGALAQRGKVWRVGFLSQRHVDFVDSDIYYGPFRQGMRELGYVEGKNLLIEWRSAEGKSERLPELAAELVRLNVDVLAAASTPASLAAQKATTVIPIVMIGVGDPVGNGLVKSLARPGGNSTGLSNIAPDVGPKVLELLRAILPDVTHVGLLINPSNPSGTLLLRNLHAASKKAGVKLYPIEATSTQQIANGFAVMARQNTQALLVARDPLIGQQSTQIAELAAKYRLPAVGGNSDFVKAGGLMSYGQDARESYRRAAIYIDKIFKGAKPSDLPIETPTTFTLAINRKTAKALGLAIPSELLLRADEVIE